jgi:hypothetical protein
VRAGATDDLKGSETPTGRRCGMSVAVAVAVVKRM